MIESGCCNMLNPLATPDAVRGQRVHRRTDHAHRGRTRTAVAARRVLEMLGLALALGAAAGAIGQSTPPMTL